MDSKTINTITGIFLLILAVSGNFVAETLGCKSQKLLSENMFAKNIIIILVIYFALGITDPNNKVIPTENMTKSLVIWIFFVIFNKMSLTFTLISFVLLATILICKDFIDYYEANEEKDGDKVKNLKDFVSNIFMINIVLIIIGFLLYFSKQYKEHYKNFSFPVFLFGKTKCDSLK
jgi:hypothetical protein